MKCIIKDCAIDTISETGICGICSLKGSLADYVNGASHAREDVKNMYVGALEESKVDFMERKLI